MLRLYGEFFLDDMESPYAVYENKYSNNRWAGMLGMQFAHDTYLAKRPLQVGTIAEIARVEPYTYCHYDTASAQMAHLGAPQQVALEGRRLRQQPERPVQDGRKTFYPRSPARLYHRSLAQLPGPVRRIYGGTHFWRRGGSLFANDAHVVEYE